MNTFRDGSEDEPKLSLDDFMAMMAKLPKYAKASVPDNEFGNHTMSIDERLWFDRQLYGNSYERVSRVPCEPCQQIGECPKCHNTRFVEVRERIHPLDVIVSADGELSRASAARAILEQNTRDIEGLGDR